MAFLSKKIIFLAFAVVALSIPLTVSLVQRQAEIRSRATAATTLSFIPSSSVTMPLQKKVGDTFSLQVAIDPGVNLVTTVSLQINYDPTKLQLINSPTAFTQDEQSFPQLVSGPTVNPGILTTIVSIGQDPSRAVKRATSVGMITFKSIAPTTDTPTTVSFGSITQVNGLGSSDNVLSNTAPAIIIISR